jgi:steroid delta-isomerase-like uncharacterized protein
LFLKVSAKLGHDDSIRYNRHFIREAGEKGHMASDRPTVAGADETRTSMSRQQMIDFFKRRWESYEDLDAEALAADYADHAEIESPTAGVHTGREAAEKTFRLIFSAFLDLTTTVDNLIIDGNTAVTVLSLEGTHIGEFLGLPPTGKRFTMPAVFFYQLENGKIVRERRIYDFTGLLVQIGVLKAKPA